MFPSGSSINLVKLLKKLNKFRLDKPCVRPCDLMMLISYSSSIAEADINPEPSNSCCGVTNEFQALVVLFEVFREKSVWSNFP